MSAEPTVLTLEPDPNRVAGEAGILGVLVWLPDFAPARLARVEREDFVDARHQMIFDAVSSLHSQKKKADLPSVVEWLTEQNGLEAAGGLEYLVRLVDTATYNGARQFESYVAAVKVKPGRVNGSVSSQQLSVSGESGQTLPECRMQDAECRVERTGDVIDGAGLLDELKRVFERFVILPPRAAEVLALWTLHTYAWGLRSVTTYLGVISPQKRCGKTTLLMLLDKLVCRPQLASNISPPAIFRAIEETQPTLLIDEADTFLEGNDELRGMLNAGYTRESAYVLRATGEGQTLRRFSCWCPKVIACIGSLPETLADRCVIIRMRRKTVMEKCERLRGLETLALYDRCRRWVDQNETAIQSAQPRIPATLNDRAGDIWEPLLALADIAGGQWPELAREAAVSMNTEDEEQDLTTMLLGDIERVLLVAGVEKVFSRYLVEALAKIPERPWREARRGGPINELWLAQQLSPFGIQSRTVRIGVMTAKGYCLEDFADAFARYLPAGKKD